MAVLTIITALNLFAIKLTVDYLYKVAFTAPITDQFISSRIEQQEYYAWHGQFDDSRRDYPLPEFIEQLPEIERLYSQNGRMVVAMKPFQQYPSTQLTLMLDDSHNSVIRPICQIEQNETFHLMPYICKINTYEKR